MTKEYLIYPTAKISGNRSLARKIVEIVLYSAQITENRLRRVN